MLPIVLSQDLFYFAMHGNKEYRCQLVRMVIHRKMLVVVRHFFWDPASHRCENELLAANDLSLPYTVYSLLFYLHSSTHQWNLKIKNMNKCIKITEERFDNAGFVYFNFEIEL